MKWLAFNDPFFTEEPPYCETVRLITEENAILLMKICHPDRDYTDLDALHDFMADNSAWYIEAFPPPAAEPEEGTK